MRLVMMVLLAMVLSLTGCKSTDQVEKPDKSKAENVEKPKKEDKEEPADTSSAWWNEEDEAYQVAGATRELTQIEQILLKKEGPYSGDKYDEAASKKKLAELPKTATAEEIEQAILKLVRSDYQKEVETLVLFDSTVEVDLAKPEEQKPELAAAKSHFSILLDASGSMKAKNKGGTRWQEANNAIESFVKTLPSNSTVSIRVYGHKGSGSDKDKALSCGKTETIYKGDADSAKVKQSLSKINPSGWTPIGKALADSKQDIPDDAASAIVYVISDGIETCGSDPVKEAKKLAANGVQPIVNIIGFQVDNEAQQLLKKVAEAGNGEFSYVTSKQELDNYWSKENERLQKAWDEWKQEAVKLAIDKKDELIKKAIDNGDLVSDKAIEEFDRATILLEDLVKSKEIPYTEQSKVSTALYNRKMDIMKYGYDMKMKNWSDSYDSGMQAWGDALNEGNKKWTEYYKK